MAFDPVPWFVGGGAAHSPEVARLLAYAAVGGAEGVIAPADLKVTPLAVPGAAVLVAPGACAITARSVGGSQQSYMGRNVTAESIAVAETGSTGGRSDLIVARVEDPFMSGEPWPDPVDPVVGPYVFARVVSGVPAGTTRLQSVAGHATDSGIALARIDLPASTGTVTAAMITDLRGLARARSTRRMAQVNSTGTPIGTGRNKLESSSFVAWPSAASFALAIPAWATHAIIRGAIEGYAIRSDQIGGLVRIQFASQSTVATSFDENHAGGDARNSIGFGGELAISSALRGTTQTLIVQGQRLRYTGFLDADQYTTTQIDVTFEERIS